MNFLLLTLVDIYSIDERAIYTYLSRHFVNRGHDVNIVCPKARRKAIGVNLQVRENHRFSCKYP